MFLTRFFSPGLIPGSARILLFLFLFAFLFLFLLFSIILHFSLADEDRY